MHCSDEELLAHLDGELSQWRRTRVRRHLQLCWQCRTRTATYEQEIQQLTRGMDEWQYPGPHWLADGRVTLNRRIRESETLLSYSIPKRTSADRRLAWSLIALAVFAIMAPLWLWLHRSGNAGAPEVIRRAQDVEGRLYRRPVEQTFAVQVAQVLPARKPASSRLRVWADGKSGRFASKWYGEDGSYKQALWQPQPGNEYLYRPIVSRAVVHRDSHRTQLALFNVVSTRAVDSDGMEAAFMQWMENRTWTPVSLAPEASLWLSNGGIVASTKVLRPADGSRVIRISVSRRVGPVLGSLTIDFDDTTYEPRVQILRFETAERAVELRLTATAIRPVLSSEMPAALFSPDVANPPESAVASRLEVTPEILPSQAREPESRLGPEVAIRMTEAQFVLHASRVCLGEPARVEEATGGIHVQNLGEVSANWPEAFTTAANLHDVMGALADLRNNFRLPAEDSTSPVPRNALLHAWALRRLGQDFPRETVAVLPEHSRAQLQSMANDHVTGLRSALGSSLTGAVLRPAQPEAGRVRDWRESAVTVFEILLDLNSQSDLDGLSMDRVNAELRTVTESFGLEIKR